MLPQLPTSLAAPLRPRTNNAARACSQTTSAVERNRTSAAPTNLISSLISGRPVAKPTSPPGRRGRGGEARAAGGDGRVPDSRAGPRPSLSALRIFRRRRGRERTLSAPRSGRRTGLGPLSAATGVAASPRYRHCNRAGLAFVGTPDAARRRDNGTKKANVRRTCR